MRLHHLQVQAFGPFADEATVDFDALSDAGLFLLTGATGAGKTSVLDAVCFALYGEVPGDRQSAKRLRCDQATDGVPPRVTLELSLGGRRFRIVRSPAWERAKKRGTGTTTEQASVRLSERVHGEWRQLSSRLDETGHLVSVLVGMNLTQFCQVALLPQGRFQAFLRARSDERHKLLQQLFRTGRFEDVERWLRDHRLTLRRTSRDHHEVVAALVNRVSEAAGEPLPDDWDLHNLDEPARQGALSRWARSLRAAADDEARTLRARARRAVQAEAAARSTLEQATRLGADQRRHAAALTERDRLAADDAAHRSRIDALVAARRAAGVVPLHRRAVTAHGACAAAEREASTLVAVAGVPVAELPATWRELRESAAGARALLPRETRLVGVRSAAERARAETSRLEESLVAAETAAALLAAREQLTALRARRSSAQRAASLESELAEARSLLVAAVDEVHLRKEEWLALQEARIHGMAAELAGALAVGHDCPVCGSVDHPRPAAAAAGAPDAAAEKAARSLVDDAEGVRTAREEQVRTLETTLAVARERAGDTSALADQVSAAEAEVARLQVLGTGPAPARSREEVAAALVEARAALESLTTEAAALAAEVAAALAGTGAPDLATLVADLDRRAQACEDALDAVRRLDRAREAAGQADTEAADAAVQAGFATTGDALGAALDDDEAAALEAAVRDHEAALAAAERTLSDPALRAAAAAPPPDLHDLTRRHEAAADELADARSAAALAGARCRRLAGLDDELDTALGAWTPVRDDLALATRVASLCDGSSPDNRLQMRLSGYVLAWRLTQVVAAANERLARMSDQRYSLEHTGRRGAGESRGGLSLLVRDDWSGEARDPATLSGGETFVVSLALALGLADVIAHEVGGAELDTLFVDEGFGSLDADTLDDVMDTLDTLRDGGRVVGVVSHVAEMRDRIPTQLRVTKSRLGSSLAVAR